MNSCGDPNCPYCKFAESLQNTDIVHIYTMHGKIVAQTLAGCQREGGISLTIIFPLKDRETILELLDRHGWEYEDFDYHILPKSDPPKTEYSIYKQKGKSHA